MAVDGDVAPRHRAVIGSSLSCAELAPRIPLRPNQRHPMADSLRGHLSPVRDLRRRSAPPRDPATAGGDVDASILRRRLRAARRYAGTAEPLMRPLRFSAPLWQWRARHDAWFFVSVPEEQSDEIRARAQPHRRALELSHRGHVAHLDLPGGDGRYSAALKKSVASPRASNVTRSSRSRSNCAARALSGGRRRTNSLRMCTSSTPVRQLLAMRLDIAAPGIEPQIRLLSLPVKAAAIVVPSATSSFRLPASPSAAVHQDAAEATTSCTSWRHRQAADLQQARRRPRGCGPRLRQLRPLLRRTDAARRSDSS